MKTKKVVSMDQLPIALHPVTLVASYLFLWDRFPYEWFRTLLGLVLITKISVLVFSLFMNKQTKVKFED